MADGPRHTIPARCESLMKSSGINSQILPLVAACLLLAGAGIDRLRSPAAADSASYLKSVREAYASTPKRLGHWVGTDVPVPVSAITLLRPNVVLSREYLNVETGIRATFLLVHCGDARDILGHYPPVCYPSAGWVLQSAESRHWNVNDQMIPGYEYRFASEPASGLPSLVVMNTMLLPDGEFHEDMAAVRKTASRLRRRSWGAGQIQVLVDESLAPAQRDEVFVSLVQAHWALIKSIVDADGREVNTPGFAAPSPGEK
jgi:hypothetical protein